MISYLALAVFLAGGVALAAVFIRTGRVARLGPAPYADVAARAYRIRLFWFFALGGILTAAFLSALPYVPYAQHRLASGSAAVQVTVTASQYQWVLGGDVSSGVKVDFAVTSTDVNHGFGVYDASGHLVGQVQAMPGYTNHLVLQLPSAGDYTIRCLEYCGPGHSQMYMTMHVTQCKTGCCC